MVELIGVTGGYGRQMAVQDFSLTLPSGEVAALVGPNGCGKSTLLRMARESCRHPPGRCC